MRKDMGKVLTERPRAGGKKLKKRYIAKHFDKKTRASEKRDVFGHKGTEENFSLKSESMRKRYKAVYEAKEFTDHISPLKHYLLSQVGRKWDDVWSDICAVLKGNGLQAYHVKDHVKNYVGGIPHSGQPYFQGWYKPGGYGNIIYVDEHGILRKNTKKHSTKKTKYFYVREGENIEYHKINGAWYWCKIERAEEEKELHFSGYYTVTRYYAVNKRALSKKEIKKLRLNHRYEMVPPRLEM